MQSPNDALRRPSRGHSAGFLTNEAVVTYPFHPLAGQSVIVTGDCEHDGVHYRMIRGPHGGSFQIPDWMFDPAASSLEIVAVPRFPVAHLLELRALLDRIVACPSAKEGHGGKGNENADAQANGSVRHSGSTIRSERCRTTEGRGTPAGAAHRSNNKVEWRAADRRQEESGQ